MFNEFSSRSFYLFVNYNFILKTVSHIKTFGPRRLSLSFTPHVWSVSKSSWLHFQNTSVISSFLTFSTASLWSKPASSLPWIIQQPPSPLSGWSDPTHVHIRWHLSSSLNAEPAQHWRPPSRRPARLYLVWPPALFDLLSLTLSLAPTISIILIF